MSLGKGNWVLFIWGKYREGAKGDDRGTLAGSRGTSEPSDRVTEERVLGGKCPSPVPLLW